MNTVEGKMELQTQAKYLFNLADALTQQLRWAHERGQITSFAANQWLLKLNVQGMRDKGVRLWNQA